MELLKFSFTSGYASKSHETQQCPSKSYWLMSSFGQLTRNQPGNDISFDWPHFESEVDRDTGK